VRRIDKVNYGIDVFLYRDSTVPAQSIIIDYSTLKRKNAKTPEKSRALDSA